MHLKASLAITCASALLLLCCTLAPGVASPATTAARHPDRTDWNHIRSGLGVDGSAPSREAAREPREDEKQAWESDWSRSSHKEVLGGTLLRKRFHFRRAQLKQAKKGHTGGTPIISHANALARVGDGRIFLRSWKSADPGSKRTAPDDPPSGDASPPLDQPATFIAGGVSTGGAGRVAGQAGVLRTANGVPGVAHPPPPVPPQLTVTITMWDLKSWYVISPGIYGVNEPYFNIGAKDLLAAYRQAGIRLMRRGGNPTTRYNWEFDASNRAIDWYFESYQNYVSSDWAGNNSFNVFMMNNKLLGAESLMTVPMLGWLPKARSKLCSYAVAKYGPQQSVDPYARDCGNGVFPNGTYIKNDPTDASVPTPPSHQARWLRNIIGKFGNAAAGGVRYASLDNEPTWWGFLHRDIHPVPSTYNETLSRGLKFAQLIKSIDPGIQVMGPSLGGWYDIFYSSLDMNTGWRTYPWKYWVNPVDRQAHGGVPFLLWYLKSFKQYEVETGQKLLDIVEVHSYVAGTAGGDDADPVNRTQRVNSVRAWWDTTFVCTFCTFFDGNVTAPDRIPKILVRIQQFINQGYPGLKIALTEYSFGGEKDITGAIAMAEALGRFGKLGVRIATVQPGPQPWSTYLKAFQMFGNYDGRGSQFGYQGVKAQTSSYNTLSAYASLNKRRTILTVIVISLVSYGQKATVNLADVTPVRPIRVFQYGAQNLTAIIQLPSIPPKRSFVKIFHSYTITLLEVPLK